MKTVRDCLPDKSRGEGAVVSIYPSSLRHGPSCHAPRVELTAFDDCGLDFCIELEDGDLLSVCLAQSVVEQLRDALREIDSRLHAREVAHRAGYKCVERCNDCSGQPAAGELF